MVDSIVVRSEYQGKDIGQRLMAEIDEWAASRCAASIELNVYEFNTKAIAFYQSLGYKPLSRKMEKRLTSCPR
jgi:GNAT superfamily N-acetyltransferase